MLVFPGPIFTPPSSGGGFPSFPASGAIISATDGTGWSTDLSTLTGSIGDPNSGTTAGRITNASGDINQPSYIRRAASFSSGAQHTLSCYMKADGADYGWLNFYDGTGEFGVMFNLNTGSVVGNRSGGATPDSSGMTNYGSGWYRCWFTFTTTNNSNNAYNTQCGVSSTGNLNFTVQSTSSSVKILIWRLQFATGALDT